jgi:hypothetical protein
MNTVLRMSIVAGATLAALFSPTPKAWVKV